jgi:hypothetical protein
MMKKLTRSHTTFLDTKVVDFVLDFLSRSKDVKSFTAGMIVPKRPPSKTVGPVKMLVTSNSLVLNVNSKRYKQEMRVYGNDLGKAAESLGQMLKKKDFSCRIVYN